MTSDEMTDEKIDSLFARSSVGDMVISEEFDERLDLLAWRFIKGEKYAFDAFLSFARPRLMRVIMACGHRKDDIEDVFAEITYELYKSLHRFKGEKNVMGFVYKLATNVCYTQLRAIKRKNNEMKFSELEYEGNEDYLDTLLPECSGNDPARALISKERQSVLFREIGNLKQDFATALVMRDVCGMSYEEIAASENTIVANIKTRIFRARNKIKEKILQNRELFE
ncbi:MAG: sigma-70 family RNA polymerase sigma factor [bacterium]